MILALVLTSVLAGCGLFQAKPKPKPTPEPGLVLGDARFRVTVRDGQALRHKHGPRFDSTGYVAGVRVDGQEFLGPLGLVGEFGLDGLGVLGYDRAKVGGEFMKIGVGRLRRLSDKPYSSARNYPVVEAFATKTQRGADTVTFTQEGRTGAYAYRYLKRYRVESAIRAVLAEYELTNIGRKAFRFEHYNHNGIRFGAGEVGAGYYVRPAFGITPVVRKRFVLSGNEMRLKQRAARSVLTSAEEVPAEKSRILVGFYGGRQSVQITNDFGFTRFALYADQNGICPRTFFERRLEPGRTCTWRRVYVFQLEDK